MLGRGDGHQHSTRSPLPRAAWPGQRPAAPRTVPGTGQDLADLGRGRSGERVHSPRLAGDTGGRPLLCAPRCPQQRGQSLAALPYPSAWPVKKGVLGFISAPCEAKRVPGCGCRPQRLPAPAVAPMPCAGSEGAGGVVLGVWDFFCSWETEHCASLDPPSQCTPPLLGCPQRAGRSASGMLLRISPLPRESGGWRGAKKSPGCLKAAWKCFSHLLPASKVGPPLRHGASPLTPSTPKAQLPELPARVLGVQGFPLPQRLAPSSPWTPALRPRSAPPLPAPRALGLGRCRAVEPGPVMSPRGCWGPGGAPHRTGVSPQRCFGGETTLCHVCALPRGHATRLLRLRGYGCSLTPRHLAGETEARHHTPCPVRGRPSLGSSATGGPGLGGGTPKIRETQAGFGDRGHVPGGGGSAGIWGCTGTPGLCAHSGSWAAVWGLPGLPRRRWGQDGGRGMRRRVNGHGHAAMRASDVCVSPASPVSPVTPVSPVSPSHPSSRLSAGRAKPRSFSWAGNSRFFAGFFPASRFPGSRAGPPHTGEITRGTRIDFLVFPL